MQADVQYGWRDPDPEVFPLSVPGWNFSDKIFAHIMITIGVAASPHLLQVQLPGTLLPGPQPLPHVLFLSLTSFTLFPREHILISLSFSQSEGLSLSFSLAQGVPHLLKVLPVPRPPGQDRRELQHRPGWWSFASFFSSLGINFLSSLFTLFGESQTRSDY